MAVSASAGFDEGKLAGAAASGMALTIEIADSIAAAETVWRGLEADGYACPYQRFDWIEALSVSLGPKARIRVGIARDARGVAALLPLSEEPCFGLRLGRVPGGRNANLFQPLLRPGLAASLGPDDAIALIREIGRALGLDAVVLNNVPREWRGEPNVFAQRGRPAASPAYRLKLERDGEATLKRSMSADARKKLRAKERNLAKLGPVDVITAQDEADVDRLLGAFFQQKGERFREMGVADPFAEADIQAFVRRASLVGLPAGRPAIELSGLIVEGRPIAIFGGAAAPDRLSGMFVSFEQGETARHSPGEILITHVIKRQCELGREMFDLGVGEALYKRRICDEQECLADVAVPITLVGHSYVGLLGLGIATKRRIKANPRAAAAIAATRRLFRRSGR